VEEFRFCIVSMDAILSRSSGESATSNAEQIEGFFATTTFDMINSNVFELAESIGPWPFITRRVYRNLYHSVVVWRSRHHRKGLPLKKAGNLLSIGVELPRCIWMPQEMNWWIGIVFAAGSVFFLLGSLFSLVPDLARMLSINSASISRIFFAGSIPFTTAAYLQLFQAANAGGFMLDRSQLQEHVRWFGWRPGDIGWLSCALQFIGTLLFNVNTFDAMLPDLSWYKQDLAIWAPDLVGSVLFLISGYLAFIETCHRHWAWQPNSISWWVTFTNLLGCVGFMISALFSVVLPRLTSSAWVTVSLPFTLVGAFGFLIGLLLMLPEIVIPSET
jgi:hypothetical protein